MQAAIGPSTNIKYPKMNTNLLQLDTILLLSKEIVLETINDETPNNINDAKSTSYKNLINKYYI